MIDRKQRLPMAAVEVADLRFAYSTAETVLNGIHLSLAEGEAHAVLGGSGAGKTTLLNLLAGLLSPDAGTIRFDGRDVTRLGGAARNVAQVFQFPVLYPTLNVADNIGFALRNRGWTRGAARKRVGEVAELLEMVPLLRKRPASLSLFEKQLVAIARALARPDVALVLLDEPLTAVEPATKWRLRRALKKIQQELGMTMVYVTHDQAEALTFADRITMLHRGGVLQTGTPLALYEAPAHTAVARFIGSPGMNLVPAEVRDGQLRVAERRLAATDIPDGPCVVGFRPEWARVETQSKAGGLVSVSSGIPVALESVRILGTEKGVPVGMIAARLEGGTIHVRQRLHADGGAVDVGGVRDVSHAGESQSGTQNPPLSKSAMLRLETKRLVVFRNDQHCAPAGVP